jgi:hypothetical protein
MSAYQDLKRDIDDIKAGQYHIYKKLANEMKTIQKTVQSISPLSKERAKYNDYSSNYLTPTTLNRNFPTHSKTNSQYSKNFSSN